MKLPTNLAALLLGLTLLGPSGNARAQAQSQPTTQEAPAPAKTGGSDADVERAMERAKAYLYSQQRNGNWEHTPAPEKMERRPEGGPPFRGMGGGPWDPRESTSQWGGLTSIATYALLAAGESDRDERLAKAIAFLKGRELVGTYALGLHAQVWNALAIDRQKEFIPSMRKDAAILLSGLRRTGDAKGFYHYLPDDPGWDASCSQFGVLGMWACEQMGFEVSRIYWSEVEEAWLRHQHASGGWNYTNFTGMPGMQRPGGFGGGGFGRRGGFGGGPEIGDTLSMTAAGVATLFITGDYLHSDAGMDCLGNYQNPAINAGMKWIADHYTDLATDRHYYYTVFGISRIGLASGRKYIGTHDWFKEGVAQFVSAQNVDGSFQTAGGGTGSPVSDTAFALLFLARGRAPLMMSKVEYDLTDKAGHVAEGPWNQRPRDIANLARWVGRRIEHPLNWQIVKLDVPAASLHEAPILYFAGNRNLSLSEADIDTLRLFVEQGGLILGNADCGNKLFAKSFEALGSRLFHKYEFRDLPDSHVLFTNEQYSASKWKIKPRLRGLSNGVRELMLLIPDHDTARAWQGRNERTREEAYQLGADIFLYAVDKKNLLNKGVTYLVDADPQIQTTSTLAVARLDVGENSDPEPAGWARLAAILHNQDHIALTVAHAKADAASLQGVKVAHLTGTTRWKFNEEQRKAIKDFITGGGTLIVDAAGGNTDFGDSAEAELQTIFGADALKPLAPESPVFNVGGEKLGPIQYRAYARRGLLNSDLNLPRIKAIEINGRPAVFFSREDLSAGLVGEQIDGIYGYTPDSATRLMSSLLKYAATSK